MSTDNMTKIDIGRIKGLKVKVISETGWFNNKVLLSDIEKAGGMSISQYEIPWTDTGVKEGYKGNNAGGFSTLIEVELLDGSKKKILLDTGWNPSWMEKRFQEEGIDKMLTRKEIDFMVCSHEHFDHFWGIEATTKYYPDIPIYVPRGFYQEGFDLLQGKAFLKANVKNAYPHTGKITVLDSGKVTQLFPGAALVTFDVPIICRVFGEQAFLFNIQDKGIVLITGCCHMGIISFLQYVKETIAGGEKIYGIQGGLHISPFENLEPQYDAFILSLRDYGIEKIASNHCTGYLAVEKMIQANLPVIKGTARNGSKWNSYLGNGDELIFA
ncbi:metallo-beta-lactamase [Lucifera butyrica]|uniref:Metallo-beta-lactamase n=1 Tax=Lucifera butyrica TaxID=1351585 RepID=A0A498RA10_9FIRM|nr:MBL fold metallo-hydrolase [Lucifera butyrica]VBB08374.1 metallo-beta-lactamase [Lucifera butyrica]